MHVNFEINEDYLIAHTLYSTSGDRFSSDRNKENIVAFQNKAWDISQRGYNFLVGRFFPEGIIDTPLEEIVEVVRESQDLVRELRNIDEYRKILEQTKEYQREVERQWRSNFNTSLQIMQELTGITFEDDEFTVYLTHSSLKNGLNLGNKRIAWGHNEDFERYTTVYLWHEILHDKLGSDDIGHSLIQLSTDNELRTRLNGGQYPPFVGHPNLFLTMEKLLPDWKEHLTSEKKDILEFEKRIKETYLNKHPTYP